METATQSNTMVITYAQQIAIQLGMIPNQLYGSLNVIMATIRQNRLASLSATNRGIEVQLTLKGLEYHLNQAGSQTTIRCQDDGVIDIDVRIKQSDTKTTLRIRWDTHEPYDDGLSIVNNTEIVESSLLDYALRDLRELLRDSLAQLIRIMKASANPEVKKVVALLGL